MAQTTIIVWFVCRLCRGSFGQVDAFIEHKKEKHFAQFQNTTCFVFEERELGELCPVIIKAENQLTDEITERPIKMEVIDEDPIIPFSSEVIDEPNLDLVELKSELISYESEINPNDENNYVGLKQPGQNSYMLDTRLTSEEIQSACVPQHHSTLLTFEQKNLVNSSEPHPNSVETDSNIIDHNEVENHTEIQPCATVRNMSTEDDLQFECKLCSKQLESDAQLKIHVGICALYHKDRNRFCVSCNRKFCYTYNFKQHRLRFHGTEEDKLSLFKFKCHICPKKYREARDLRFHLKSHKETKEQDETSNSKLPKCQHPNCGKEFRCNYDLRRHIATVHLSLRRFSCPFPTCRKTFSERGNMEKHFKVVHAQENPSK